jgi:V8-like Glu-specific endopeptidase
MIAGKVTQERGRLAGRVAERFDSRREARRKKLDAVNKVGVFAAAGMTAAVRRTAHMSLAEGRTLIADPEPTGAELAAAAGATAAAPVGAADDNAPEPRAARPKGVAPAERTPERAPERMLEAVVGGLDDSDHVNFLARGVRAARAVCRLVQDGVPVGTGFLVAPGLILTNNHVIPSRDDAAMFTAEFDYELDIEDQPRQPIVRFALDPDRAFATSDKDQGLDFTFVAVRPQSRAGGERVTTFGWLPMDERRDKILEGEPAAIIQHPRGETKRVALFAAELVDRFDDYIHYTTDTDGGSSGSPVLNRGWLLVGLHHASTFTNEERRGHRVVVNEGIRISSIIRALRAAATVAGGAAGNGNGNGTEGAARLAPVEGDAAAVLSAITRPEVIADGRPQSPALPALATPGGDGSAAAESSRRRGWRGASGRTTTTTTAATFRASSARSSAAAAPSTSPARPGRPGLRARLLGAGATVPLPEMPRWMREDAAELDVRRRRAAVHALLGRALRVAADPVLHRRQHRRRAEPAPRPHRPQLRGGRQVVLRRADRRGPAARARGLRRHAVRLRPPGPPRGPGVGRPQHRADGERRHVLHDQLCPRSTRT